MDASNAAMDQVAATPTPGTPHSATATSVARALPAKAGAQAAR
jgi:hypothetical protein